jgi:hypothetical protein
MDNSQDLLRKGFYLAHFIVSDRATALRIVGDARSKLEVYRSQERKRTYWRHKYLKRKITRVIRQDNDMLQWLIYFEAEKHEKQHEQTNLPSMEDLVIRYMKHLAQVTTPMSSFYVNIGFQRLLHNYSTAETRSIYERVTDHFPGNEEYRKVKAALMSRLQARFGNLLKTCQGNRGELRFEPYDRQENLAELVRLCLSEFTPWSMSPACCLSDPARQIHWPENGYLANKSGKRSLDAVETYRSHIFIHPPCFANLIQQLGLDSSYQRLSVPRFSLNANGDQEGKPAASREPVPDLTEQERQTIAGRLNREAIQRQQIQPEKLRILVDGSDIAEMTLLHETSVQYELQEAARLIEVWTADGDEEILLATHWIDYSDLHQPVKAEAKVDLGTTNQLWMKIIPGDFSARLLLELRQRSGWVPWKGYSAPSSWGQDWPKYALAISAVVLISAMGATIAYRNETVKQRATIESINRELARERASRAVIQQQLSSSASQLTAFFRLPVDDIKPRGSQGHGVPRLTIPMHAALVSLDLPVNNSAQTRYRARLKSFLENKTVLEEDYLKPVSFVNNDSKVDFVVPAAFLSPNTYYVATLEMLDENGKSVKSSTFTFYVAEKK